MSDIIDIDTGAIIDGQVDNRSHGRRDSRMMIDVASGEGRPKLKHWDKMISSPGSAECRFEEVGKVNQARQHT